MLILFGGDDSVYGFGGSGMVADASLCESPKLSALALSRHIHGYNVRTLQFLHRQTKFASPLLPDSEALSFTDSSIGTPRARSGKDERVC